MQKLIAVYIVAGLALFGGLFAAFAIAGIGRPATMTPEAPAATISTSAEPKYPALEFVPPDLEPGRTYRISHEISIFQRPDASSGSEPLPAGGYFTAVYTLTDVPGPWTQITVNNGFRDYSMYLLGTDLRWKVLTPVYSNDEQRDQRFEEILAQMRAAGEQRAARRALEAAAEEESEVPEEITFAAWWADRAERMGGATVANFVVAGAASAILTLAIIGAIVLMTMLRREHEWSKPVNPDEDAIDLQPEDDNPFTYSKSGSAFAGNDDEDPRRA